MRVASSLLLLVAVAHADPSPADVAFKRGRELLKAGKYAEACTAFEESQRLDPSLGTQFNIAQCDAETGKLATALAIYRDLAEHDTNATRKATATDLASKLAPRVPRLEVQVEPRPVGLTVVVNGVAHACPEAPCTGSLALDTGSYAIAARAAGFREATATATITEEGKVVIVALHLDALPAAAPVVEPPPPGPSVTALDVEAPRSHRTAIATGLVIAGGAGVIGGLVLGVIAHGKWNDAKAVCNGSTTCATQADADRASMISDAARSRGNLATLFVVAGGLVAAGGVVLWATAPHDDREAPRAGAGHRAVQLGAVATPGSVGVTLAGRF